MMDRSDDTAELHLAPELFRVTVLNVQIYVKCVANFLFSSTSSKMV